TAAWTGRKAQSSAMPPKRSRRSTRTWWAGSPCTRPRARTRASCTSIRAATARVGETASKEAAVVERTEELTRPERRSERDAQAAPPVAQVREEDLEPHAGLRY